MYPLVHVYVATKAAKSEDQLLVVGSILPDIAVTGIATWDETHTTSSEFRKFLRETDLSYERLAAGMMTHGRNPKGVDYLSEVQYQVDEDVGYAYAKSESLVKDVAKACNLTGQRAREAAHNFIEMAVDYWLIWHYPKTLDVLKDSINAVDRNKIARYFAEFYSKDASKVRAGIDEYFGILTSAKLGSKEGLVEVEAGAIKKIFGSDTDFQSALIILDKAIDITKSTYLEFIRNATNFVSKFNLR